MKKICPGCGKFTFSDIGFCENCDDMAKRRGIDDQAFINALPASEQVTKNMPTAEAIAKKMSDTLSSKVLIALYHRPALQSRPAIELQVR